MPGANPELDALLERVNALDRAIAEAPVNPHGWSHELGLGDEVRYAVQNDGTRLASKHRELNFSTGLSAVVDMANQRITITSDASSAWDPTIVAVVF